MLHDGQIREILFDYLDERYGKIRIFEEKNIKSSRADIIAVIDGSIIGMEIKSDFDSYARLATQVKNYDKYCDFNYAVVGRTHKNGVAEHIPAYWGILAVDETEVEPVIYEVRAAEKNPKMKTENKAAFLWKTEMHAILAKNGFPRYVGKSRRFVIGKMTEKIPADKLAYDITDALFERDYSILSEIFEK